MTLSQTDNPVRAEPSGYVHRGCDGVSMYAFPTINGSRVIHGISTRTGGVSGQPFESLNLSIKTGDDAQTVMKNRSIFLGALGAPPRKVVMGQLSHGCTVVTFEHLADIPPLHEKAEGWPAFDGDAAISNIPGLTLVMTFADCVPLLFWDPVQQVVAMAHAGWRGTALRIGSKTVRTMVQRFATRESDIQVGIGPSIGPCCYKVGEEVVDRLIDGYRNEARRFLHNGCLDLWEANSYDLLSSGIAKDHLTCMSICTSCRTDLFFSHRAHQGNTGRFGAAIGLVDQQTC